MTVLDGYSYSISMNKCFDKSHDELNEQYWASKGRSAFEKVRVSSPAFTTTHYPLDEANAECLI